MSKYVGKDPYSDIEKQKGKPNGVPSLDNNGLIIQGSAFGGVLGDIRTYTGNAVWTKPDNLKFVVVTVVGGGGAGGGCPGPTSAQQTAVGGGGGAGAFVKGLILGQNLNATENIIVGTGGNGVVGADGNNGGNSSFGTLITANGGQGGATSGIVTNSGVNASGGIGGTYTIDPSSVQLILAVEGSRGGFGRTVWNSQFGALSGNGGSTPVGTGGSYHIWITNSPGYNGTGYGSGGGGALIGDNQPAGLPGGNGAPGIVIVEEYY